MERDVEREKDRVELMAGWKVLIGGIGIALYTHFAI